MSFKMHMGYILFQCATTAHMSELSIIPLSLSEVKQRLVVCLWGEFSLEGSVGDVWDVEWGFLPLSVSTQLVVMSW